MPCYTRPRIPGKSRTEQERKKEDVCREAEEKDKVTKREPVRVG